MCKCTRTRKKDRLKIVHIFLRGRSGGFGRQRYLSLWRLCDENAYCFAASSVDARLCIYWCMDSATILLWATASTTVRAPFTTSPEAKMPGRVVWPVSSATRKALGAPPRHEFPQERVPRRPLASAASPWVVFTIRFWGPWLIEMITLSAG